MIYYGGVSFGRIKNENPQIGAHRDGNVGAYLLNGGVGSSSHWRRVGAAGFVAFDGSGPHGTGRFRSRKYAGRQLFHADVLGYGSPNGVDVRVGGRLGWDDDPQWDAVQA